MSDLVALGFQFTIFLMKIGKLTLGLLTGKCKVVEMGISTFFQRLWWIGICGAAPSGVYISQGLFTSGEHMEWDFDG